MDQYLYQDLYDLEETHWWHKAKRRLTMALIKQYAPKRNLRILDIGCGTGKNVEVFGELGQSWGVDVSPDAIAFCKKRGLKNITLSAGEKSGFKPERFDVITILDVLEHTDEKRMTQEIYRLLARGGIVIVSVPAYGWLWSRWDEVLHHKRRYTVRSLSQALKKQRFTMLKATYTQSFLLLPVVAVRQVKQLLYKGREYPSDFRAGFPGMNSIFSAFSWLETQWILRFSMPFGLSVVAVAKK